MFKFRFAAYFNFISVYHLPATAARKETLYEEILSKTEIWRHITFHKSVNHVLSKDSLENGHRPKLVGKTDNPHSFVEYIYIYIYIYIYLYIYIFIYIKYIFIYVFGNERTSGKILELSLSLATYLTLSPSYTWKTIFFKSYLLLISYSFKLPYCISCISRLLLPQKALSYKLTTKYWSQTLHIILYTIYWNCHIT